MANARARARASINMVKAKIVPQHGSRGGQEALRSSGSESHGHDSSGLTMIADRMSRDSSGPHHRRHGCQDRGAITRTIEGCDSYHFVSIQLYLYLVWRIART